CIALDGGYTQFISQLLHDAPALSDKNFCCPIRKSAGVSLTSSEALYNEMFGSFRSSIESKFGELVSTFCKFGNGSPIRVNNIDTFVVQFQLACLLLNIKDFVHMLNMPLRPHHSLWEQTGFDFGGVTALGSSVEVTVNIEKKIEDANSLQRLQEQFLGMNFVDDPVDEDNIEDQAADDEYEVEHILGHKGSSKHRKYRVKWKGYPRSESSWVRASDLDADELIEEYWAEHRS
ncbi:hypothetical protein EV177_009777, partial [Coemansia sp. RSA 1804]